MSELTLTSTAFDDGERIPDRYGYTETNVNPPLEVDGVPDEAESLALIVDDPDAVDPAGKVWDHWVVWNIPPDRQTIPENWHPDDADEGANDYGSPGYGGPNPPDREHTYEFTLYALETTLDLEAETDADALRSAIEGHVLAETQLTGTYPA
ncbi:YbhB/YbcL family Raf kinase inhibitor-like protein [Natronorubrum aibiense]|uniref:YbhB/YbcL family Raf kinase inhibitor-like protein n=1 Tax=Natronorubrum aibiense TaxID=348826 RepID=A0A5P9P7B9_9EURY|nr:YbhB/YbcL family Raf kinase inhibitor-like protein [Natronorubrum aibiense]QFU84033.1 YbhB/YbcL family Raf kinase inhibitor-like protein [Natronorubrum aibiense]